MSDPTYTTAPPPVRPKPIPVVLLKTKSTPTDIYEEYFSRDGRFAPQFVPVLEHTFNAANLQKLRRLLTDGHDGDYLRDGETRYGGMIFTSQRAVEAFAGVVREVGAWTSYSPPLPFTSPSRFALYQAYIKTPTCHSLLYTVTSNRNRD
jgi:hypothetical protein